MTVKNPRPAGRAGCRAAGAGAWEQQGTAAHGNTHRALMDELEAFEQDLHRHVHEENNILLARVREPAQTATEFRDGLLPCCEGWIAEQTHRWATHRR